MAIPKAKFVGLSSADPERYKLPRNVGIKLNDKDNSRVKELINYEWFHKKTWPAEITRMLSSGRPARTRWAGTDSTMPGGAAPAASTSTAFVRRSGRAMARAREEDPGRALGLPGWQVHLMSRWAKVALVCAGYLLALVAGGVA